MEAKKLSQRAQKLQLKVMVVQTTNPKKPDSMSHKRYAILLKQCANGATPTIEALLKAGYRMDDVNHDEAHGFIVIGDKGIKEHGARLERERLARIEEARKLLAEVDAK